jgi:hypothetical protein
MAVNGTAAGDDHVTRSRRPKLQDLRTFRGMGARCQAHPANRQRVGHGRGLQVHVEAAVEVRRWHAVDQPPARSVSLEQGQGESGG